jgi:lipopolysaccharide transport system ATP-binding protein
VDEVLTVGDMEFQRRCLGKMEGVAREGRTVLIVSHNLGVVNQLCQRVVWLNKGRLELDGKSRDVITAYCSQNSVPNTFWERVEPTNGAVDAALCSVRLLQKPDQIPGAFDFDLPLRAQIEYEVRTPMADFRVLLRILTESGTIVFTSSDLDRPQESIPGPRTEGRYISTCKIPGSLLRPGKFFLTVATRQGSTWLEQKDNLLMFEISQVGYSLPERLGVISPILDWEVRKQDSSES